ncbi:MAG: hypothetical protein KDG55_13480 [Rhodocyclaceae bacterium]|nr:hypothetical protein [Rhodocyclaceae bacterium]
MHIQAVTTESISPARLLRQLRETVNDTVRQPAPSAEVSLSTDGRLATLVDQLLADGASGVDAGQVVRLLGQGAQFEDTAFSLPQPLAVDARSADALALPDLSGTGFDPARLTALITSDPSALPVLRAAIDASGLASLFSTSPSETAALPASVQLYVDNGGVPGVRLDSARQPDLFAQAPLP